MIWFSSREVALLQERCLSRSCPDGWGSLATRFGEFIPRTAVETGCPAPYRKKATEMQISRALLGEDPLHHRDLSCGKYLSTIGVCCLHKLQTVLPACPQCPDAPKPARPCLLLAAIPARGWEAAAGARASSPIRVPAAMAAALPRCPGKAGIYWAEIFPGLSTQEFFPFFYAFIARNTKISSHKSACHLHQHFPT